MIFRSNVAFLQYEIRISAKNCMTPIHPWQRCGQLGELVYTTLRRNPFGRVKIPHVDHLHAGGETGFDTRLRIFIHETFFGRNTQ